MDRRAVPVKIADTVGIEAPVLHRVRTARYIRAEPPVFCRDSFRELETVRCGRIPGGCHAVAAHVDPGFAVHGIAQREYGVAPVIGACVVDRVHLEEVRFQSDLRIFFQFPFQRVVHIPDQVHPTVVVAIRGYFVQVSLQRMHTTVARRRIQPNHLVLQRTEDARIQ